MHKLLFSLIFFQVFPAWQKWLRSLHVEEREGNQVFGANKFEMGFLFRFFATFTLQEPIFFFVSSSFCFDIRNMTSN
jgi:hypothetical protein